MPEDNIKSRLLKIFKSRKWRKQYKDSGEQLKSPFTLPKCKVTKEDTKMSSETTNSWKSYKFHSERPSIFRPVRRAKSCPMDKPPSAREDIRNLQALDDQPPTKKKISFGTQTEPSWKELRRSSLKQVCFSDECSEGGLEPKNSYRYIEDTTFEDGYNMEVIQALRNEIRDIEDGVLKKRQMEVNSITNRSFFLYKYFSKPCGEKATEQNNKIQPIKRHVFKTRSSGLYF